jgi:DNA-directed RNA polymerase sigma subunit (sigma70/sigma32)
MTTQTDDLVDELDAIAARFRRRRALLAESTTELEAWIRRARRAPDPPTLRAIAAKTGLSYARIHQIEKDGHG